MPVSDHIKVVVSPSSLTSFDVQPYPKASSRTFVSGKHQTINRSGVLQEALSGCLLSVHRLVLATLGNSSLSKTSA